MKLAEEHKLFRIDFSKVNESTEDFGVIPDEEAAYLLCEREEFLRQLLVSVKDVIAG